MSDIDGQQYIKVSNPETEFVLWLRTRHILFTKVINFLRLSICAKLIISSNIMLVCTKLMAIYFVKKTSSQFHNNKLYIA